MRAVGRRWRTLSTPESISVESRRAALAVAEQMDYPLAARQLKLSDTVLRKKVSELETQLCCHIFKPKQKKVELTYEGRFLVEAFRASIALHDRAARNG